MAGYGNRRIKYRTYELYRNEAYSDAVDCMLTEAEIERIENTVGLKSCLWNAHRMRGNALAYLDAAGRRVVTDIYARLQGITDKDKIRELFKCHSCTMTMLNELACAFYDRKIYSNATRAVAR